jgi:hypothetical protein
VTVRNIIPELKKFVAASYHRTLLLDFVDPLGVYNDSKLHPYIIENSLYNTFFDGLYTKENRVASSYHQNILSDIREPISVF